MAQIYWIQICFTGSVGNSMYIEWNLIILLSLTFFKIIVVDACFILLFSV